jgi:nicotinamidase-related amidase
MKRPVLIVIDMLRDFLDEWPSNSREKLVQSTKKLVSMVRECGYPVIWVRQEFQPDLSDAFLEMRAKRIPITIKGTPGCQIVPELPIGPSEKAIWNFRATANSGIQRPAATAVRARRAAMRPRRRIA